MLQKKILAVAIAAMLFSGSTLAGKDKDLPNGQPFQNIGAQLDAHQAMLDAHQAILDSHSTRLGTLEAVTTDILGEVGSISAQLADHEARISGNEASVADILSDISAVKSDVYANQNALLALIDELGDLEGDVDSLKDEIDSEFAAVVALIADNKQELEGLLSTLESQVNLNTGDISTIRSDIAALSLSIQSQIFDLNLLIEQVRSEIPSNADIEALVVSNSVITSLLADVSSLSSSQSALQQQLNNLTLDYQGEIADIRALIGSLHSNGISDLPGFVQRVSANLSSILGNVPSNYVFNYDGYYNYDCGYIGDGGRDMYDGGNILGTNLVNGQYSSPCIEYTNGVVVESTASNNGISPFGEGSTYVTAELPGLFVAAATDMTINLFQISGNNGADNQGGTSIRQLATTVNGDEYTIFAKLVSDNQNTRDPSINQLIVVPGNGANITHNYATNTDNPLQSISGQGVQDLDALIYILTATWNPSSILSDNAIVNLVDSVLEQL